MTFKTDALVEFKNIFKTVKLKILSSKGCLHLELLQDKNNPSVLFTHSVWNDEQDLEQYRNSELFKTTWSKTKKLFGDRPEAWSTTKLVSLSIDAAI